MLVTQRNVVAYVTKGGGFHAGNQQRSRESLPDRRTRRALWHQRKNREYYDEKGPYHHQGQPKAVDASIPKPMLLGSNKLPGKLDIVGCALLNARAIAISVVRRHGSHPKMNSHVVAL